MVDNDAEGRDGSKVAEGRDGLKVADARPAAEPPRSRHGKSIIAALSALVISVAAIIVAVPIVLVVAKSTTPHDNVAQQNLRTESKSPGDAAQN